MSTGRGGMGVFVIAVVVVFAGCSGVIMGDSSEQEVGDELGEVGNVSYDDELDIDPEDGFTEEELELFVNRTMARIEAIRELEYKRTVEVEVLTREEYRDWRGDRLSRGSEPAWENQIWRGLFLIGADRNATVELDEAFDGAVQGLYQPSEERIVIVSDSEQPTIDKATLIHELVHALQHQQFGLEYGQETRDGQAAYNTLLEGEADLVPQIYLEEWCEQWSCIRPELATDGDDGVTTIDRGILLVILQPYVQGVEYVEQIRSEGGWEAVNDLHDDPPRSTAATIYPDREQSSSPVEISVPDRSTREWDRFDHEPAGDTLGATSLYAMFAANEIIEEDEPGEYAHPVVEGWTGDRFVPYRSGEEFGYVWELAWESPEEAERFAEAYRELLASHGALARGAESFVIEDGPFAGAYRMTVDGDRVLIVNGPTLDDLSAIHAR